MKLAILDIDGTLTNTSRVDEICFTRAMAETHGLTEIGASWANCPHVSDSGITQQIFLDHFNREPNDDDLSPLKSRFFDLLHEHHALDAGHFAEVPGAREMVSQLEQKEDWVITIATGCWRGSAKMKLAAANSNSIVIPAVLPKTRFRVKASCKQRLIVRDSITTFHSLPKSFLLATDCGT